MTQLINLVFLLLLSGCVSLFLFLFFKSRRIQPENRLNQEALKYNITSLIEHVREAIHDITRTNLFELGLNETEFRKHTNKRAELKKALKNCMYGSAEDKQFVKAFICDILAGYIPADKINTIIPFGNPYLLSVKDKFFILLHAYRKEHGMNALSRLIEENNLDGEKRGALSDDSLCYRITAEEIQALYEQKAPMLRNEDKLEIITQAVYEKYKGLGVIDDIRDMNIDGVSGGVSGVTDDALGGQFAFDERHVMESRRIPRCYESVWIFYKGKSIKLDFLSFESEKELRRVCQNIYRYNRGGQLSEANGYRVNEMKDGSRVLVVRPPFSESWAFFVRRFHIKNVTLEMLIADDNASLPIGMIKFLVKGCMITSVTGQQGSGKTTLLMAMIRHIYATLTLRIQEMAFELHLRKLYPGRNILSFRETENISGQQGLDIQKKTDGSVNILGEVATDPVAAWMIQMAQVASLFTLFTHHAKTTRDLVYSLRNSLLKCEMFSNERIAEQQVVSVLDFDIHLSRDFSGKRYIERITEIVETPAHEPYPLTFREDKPLAEKLEDFLDTTCEFYARSTDRLTFETRNILEFRNGRYEAAHPISPAKLQRMLKAMTSEDGEALRAFVAENWGEAS